jgi:hypothetical protein
MQQERENACVSRFTTDLLTSVCPRIWDPGSAHSRIESPIDEIAVMIVFFCSSIESKRGLMMKEEVVKDGRSSLARPLTAR